jgi:hypothetical protein
LNAATPELVDLGLVLQAELLLGLGLGGQAVGVPAEAPLDVAAAHGLVARHDVLDVAGEQVAVVRQAVGEGWAVVEDELVAAVVARGPGVDRGLERVVGVQKARTSFSSCGNDGCAGTVG